MHINVNDVVYFSRTLFTDAITSSWVKTMTVLRSHDEYSTDVVLHDFAAIGNY